MSVSINFIDGSRSSYSGYYFAPLPEFGDHWTVVPRVGDCIYDANEFKYTVVEVGWWGPHRVGILLERA